MRNENRRSSVNREDLSKLFQNENLDLDSSKFKKLNRDFSKRRSLRRREPIEIRDNKKEQDKRYDDEIIKLREKRNSRKLVQDKNKKNDFDDSNLYRMKQLELINQDDIDKYDKLHILSNELKNQNELNTNNLIENIQKMQTKNNDTIKNTKKLNDEITSLRKQIKLLNAASKNAQEKNILYAKYIKKLHDFRDETLEFYSKYQKNKQIITNLYNIVEKIINPIDKFIVNTQPLITDTIEDTEENNENKKLV